LDKNILWERVTANLCRLSFSFDTKTLCQQDQKKTSLKQVHDYKIMSFTSGRFKHREEGKNDNIPDQKDSSFYPKGYLI